MSLTDNHEIRTRADATGGRWDFPYHTLAPLTDEQKARMQANREAGVARAARLIDRAFAASRLSADLARAERANAAINRACAPETLIVDCDAFGAIEAEQAEARDALLADLDVLTGGMAQRVLEAVL